MFSHFLVLVMLSGCGVFSSSILFWNIVLFLFVTKNSNDDQ